MTSGDALQMLPRHDDPMYRTAIKAIVAAAIVFGVGLPATAASASASQVHLSGGVSCTEQMPASMTSLPSQCGMRPVNQPVGGVTLGFLPFLPFAIPY